MPVTMTNAILVADLVTFNNLLNFTSAQSIQVTDHPVEFGVDVSDHAQVKPNELVFAVQITKSPLGIPNIITIEAATSWFERNQAKPININAPAGIFSNYVISRWDYTEQQGQRVFNVTAREVRFALAVSVPVPARIPNPVAANGLASASASGAQAATPAPTPPASTLATVLGVVGG